MFLLAWALRLATTAPALANLARLGLDNGDSVIRIGNPCAGRMSLCSHFGTVVAALHPEHALTFRDLEWSGDTLSIQPRPCARDRARQPRCACQILGVWTIHIIEVPKELRCDTFSFSVGAGRPVEIMFGKPDEMPQILLITKPGSPKEIGEAGDAMAGHPDAFQKQYVQDTPSVLRATPLPNKGESIRLRVTAPSEPGGYSYVCPFPGHWTTINGIMYGRLRHR